MGTWWASWVSNPWCGANNVVGRFDSDAPPPFSLNSVSLNSVSLPQFLCLSSTLELSWNPNLAPHEVIICDLFNKLRPLHHLVVLV